MKKLLHFLMFLGFVNFTIAQTCDENLPITEHFDDSSVVGVCWNPQDQDGDGLNWYWRDYGSLNGGYKCLTSRSYSTASGALTPDNWIISYAINLTSFSTNDNIELSWKVRGDLAGFSHEYYTLYAATSDQTTNIINGSNTVSISEYADEVGGNGVFVTRTMDISSLAGNMVYIAFRHHNSTNQYSLNIDDVSVTTQALGIEDFNDDNFNFYYNKNDKTLNLSSANKPINSVEVFSILGQNIITKLSAQNSETLDLSSLTNGVYVARITIDGTDKSIKFIKS